jgi:probable F420-dependent oxidoreductase
VQELSVRVGAGWSPFDRSAVGGPLFWQTVDQLERDGWDSLWLSDVATGPGAAPLPMLAAVAARTERLKLGTSVLVAPPRNPLLLAKELATVDVISGGRLFPVLGIGQAVPEELAALGVPREERGARLEECMAVVRELWRGEPVTFDGRFSSLDRVTLSPRPTRPRIELWLGGSTPPAVRRVARVADGWLASAISPARFAELVELLRNEAAAAGRTVPEDHFGTVFFAAATDEEVAPLRERERLTGKDLPAVAVGADGVRALLHAFRDAGATKFVLYPLSPDPRALFERLKSEVVDEFEVQPVVR